MAFSLFSGVFSFYGRELDSQFSDFIFRICALLNCLTKDRKFWWDGPVSFLFMWFVGLQVIYSRDTDQSRGFGFVTMSTVEEAEKAVETFHQYVSSICCLSCLIYSICSLF